MRTLAILLSTLCALLILAACGTRTSLKLPPKPAPAESAQPSASTAAPPKADDSKAGDNASR
jgi:predicted small lipoprotein YifL